MRWFLVCLFVVSAVAARAQEPLRPELKTLLDITLDPKAFHNQTVSVGCLITSANLMRAICPVWNEKGIGIGAATIDLEHLSAPMKRAIVNRCAGSGQEPACYAMVSARVDATYALTFKPTRVLLPDMP
jgi:hypothetical protein